MGWAGWVLVLYFAANALFTVAKVGKPRPIVHGPAAAISVVIYCGLIFTALKAARVL